VRVPTTRSHRATYVTSEPCSRAHFEDELVGWSCKDVIMFSDLLK
jgi:hypothetical protein